MSIDGVALDSQRESIGVASCKPLLSEESFPNLKPITLIKSFFLLRGRLGRWYASLGLNLGRTRHCQTEAKLRPS